MATNALVPVDPHKEARAVLRSQLEKQAAEFKLVLPSHITPDKFQRTIMTAVLSNPELLLADRQSLMVACMKAAQDALLPDGREAALVIYNTSIKDRQTGEWKKIKLVQYQSMVFGLRKKVLQTEEVKDIFANVVYRQEIEAGRFIYEEGADRTLRHRPILEMDFEPNDDDIALAYSVAILENGLQSYEVMRRKDINKVRQMSQTGALFDKKGNPRDPSGPWVDWFSEQCKKTVVRRHTKSLPQTGDIIDVELEDDIAAQSVVRLLGSEDKPEPTRLPTKDELGGATSTKDPPAAGGEGSATEDSLSQDGDAAGAGGEKKSQGDERMARERWVKDFEASMEKTGTMDAEQTRLVGLLKDEDPDLYERCTDAMAKASKTEPPNEAENPAPEDEQDLTAPQSISIEEARDQVGQTELIADANNRFAELADRLGSEEDVRELRAFTDDHIDKLRKK